MSNDRDCDHNDGPYRTHTPQLAGRCGVCAEVQRRREGNHGRDLILILAHELCDSGGVGLSEAAHRAVSERSCCTLLRVTHKRLTPKRL